MWSVGISVSPSKDALRLGYDDRQINRIVIRMAQYFLDRGMQVIFGHDWRNDGVMQAVADFAGRVSAHPRYISHPENENPPLDHNREAPPRMLNVVATGAHAISNTALNAEELGGGILKVTSMSEQLEKLSSKLYALEGNNSGETGEERRAWELTCLRHCLTALLHPGCRICFGGITEGFQGKEPGVTEEAKLALIYEKPLYLMGGFGGATRCFGEDQRKVQNSYWKAENGLCGEEKNELFDTTDIEHALRLISKGIESHQNPQY